MKVRFYGNKVQYGEEDLQTLFSQLQLPLVTGLLWLLSSRLVIMLKIDLSIMPY